MYKSIKLQVCLKIMKKCAMTVKRLKLKNKKISLLVVLKCIHFIIIILQSFYWKYALNLFKNSDSEKKVLNFVHID